MPNHLTTRQVILWYLRRRNIPDLIKCAFWLTTRRRNYRRLLTAFKQRVRLRNRHVNNSQKRPKRPELVCETDRLILRPLCISDLDAVAALLPNSDAEKTESANPKAQWRRELSLVSEILQGWVTLVAVCKDMHKTIGTFALTIFEIDGQTEYELGFRVHFDHFGKGYATEGAMALRNLSFQQLKLRRLVSVISPSNIASIRVAEKNEMKFEREWSVSDDRVFIYSIDRPREM